MEQLILFVFKHWYLAIIALTFFYQIRKKWFPANQGNKNEKGMPSFGGAPRKATRPSEASRPAQKGVDATLQSGRVQGEYARSDGARPASTMPRQKVSPFGSPAQVGTDSPPMYAEPIFNPSPFPDQPKQDQLLQGVIWAEILGPPRSKKPFRR